MMNERARRAIHLLLSALLSATVVALPASALANTAPTLSGTPPAAVSVGSAYAFTPGIANADGDVLTFGLNGCPAWLNVDTATGRVYGTPTSANVGVYSNLRLVVYDGTYYRSLPYFSITVKAAPVTNGAPKIAGTPAASVLAGRAYAFTPTASDPDGDALTFSVANKPAWATFDAKTGRLTGTPGAGAVGSYASVTIAVSDGRTKTSLAPFTIAVNAIEMGTATVTWDAPTTNADGSPLTRLAGYRVVYGRAANQLTLSAKLANPTLTRYVVENLSVGAWYFAVVAYTTTGEESALSGIVSTTIVN